MKHRIYKSYHRKAPNGKYYIWHGRVPYRQHLLASRYVRKNW